MEILRWQPGDTQSCKAWRLLGGLPDLSLFLQEVWKVVDSVLQHEQKVGFLPWAFPAVFSNLSIKSRGLAALMTQAVKPLLCPRV